MSDPITNVEIEDVLASIRRLVSTGDSNQRSGAQKREQNQGERLVLTPALRVTDPPKTEPANAHIAPWGPFSAGRGESAPATEKTAAPDETATANAADDLSGGEPVPATEEEAPVTEDAAGLTVTAEDLAEETAEVVPPVDAATEAPEPVAVDAGEAAAEEPPETATETAVDADDEEAVGALLADVMAAVQVSSASASFGPIAATVALAERRAPVQDSESPLERTALLDTGPDAESVSDVSEDEDAEAPELEAGVVTEDDSSEVQTVSDFMAEDAGEAVEAEEILEVATDLPAEDSAEAPDFDAVEAANADAAQEETREAELPEETAEDAEPEGDTNAAGLAAAGVGAFAAGSAAARAPDIASTVRKSIEEAIAELEARADAEDDEFEPDGSEPPLLPRVDEDRSLHDLVTSEDDEPEDVLSWDDEAPAEARVDEEAGKTEVISETDQEKTLDAVRSFLSSDEGLARGDEEVADVEVAEEDVAEADILEAGDLKAEDDSTATATFADVSDPAPAEAADLMRRSDLDAAPAEDLADADDQPEVFAEEAPEDDAVSAEIEAVNLLEGRAEDATAALYPTASEDEDTTADPQDSPAEASAPPMRSPFGRIPQMARAAFAKATGSPQAPTVEESAEAEEPVDKTATVEPSETTVEVVIDAAPEEAAEEAQVNEAEILVATEIVAEEIAETTDLGDDFASEEPDADVVAETDDMVPEEVSEQGDLETEAVAENLSDDGDLAEVAEVAEAEVAEIELSEVEEPDAEATLDAETDGSVSDAPMTPEEAVAVILEADAEEVTLEEAIRTEAAVEPEPELEAMSESEAAEDNEAEASEDVAKDAEPEVIAEADVVAELAAESELETSIDAEAEAAEDDELEAEAEAEAVAGPAEENEPEDPEPEFIVDPEQSLKAAEPAADADETPEPASEADDSPEEEPAQESGADIHQFATVRGTAPQRGNQIAASPDLDDDNTIAALYEQDNYLDEEALRDLVGDIVREELQGVLGERITRNVRKLVRREIHRILNSQDFD